MRILVLVLVTGCKEGIAPKKVDPDHLYGFWWQAASDGDPGETVLQFARADDYLGDLQGLADVYLVFSQQRLVEAGTFQVNKGVVAFDAILAEGRLDPYEREIDTFFPEESMVMGEGVSYDFSIVCPPAYWMTSTLAPDISYQGFTPMRTSQGSQHNGGLALAFDDDGELHGFIGEVGQDAQPAQYATSKGTCGFRGTPLINGERAQMDVDKHGGVHLVMEERDGGTTGRILYGYLAPGNNPVDFAFEEVGTANNGAISLLVSDDGIPVVTLGNSTQTILRKEGGSWSTVALPSGYDIAPLVLMYADGRLLLLDPVQQITDDGSADVFAFVEEGDDWVAHALTRADGVTHNGISGAVVDDAGVLHFAGTPAFGTEAAPFTDLWPLPGALRGLTWHGKGTLDGSITWELVGPPAAASYGGSYGRTIAESGGKVARMAENTLSLIDDNGSVQTFDPFPTTQFQTDYWSPSAVAVHGDGRVAWGDGFTFFLRAPDGIPEPEMQQVQLTIEGNGHGEVVFGDQRCTEDCTKALPAGAVLPVDIYPGPRSYSPGYACNPETNDKQCFYTVYPEASAHGLTPLDIPLSWGPLSDPIDLGDNVGQLFELTAMAAGSDRVVTVSSGESGFSEHRLQVHDTSGSLLWETFITGASNGVVDVDVADDGSVYLVLVPSGDLVFEGGSVSFDLPAVGKSAVIRLTAAGEVDWVKSMPATVGSVAAMEDGLVVELSLYVSWSFDAVESFGGGASVTAKFSPSGDLIWSRSGPVEPLETPVMSALGQRLVVASTVWGGLSIEVLDGQTGATLASRTGDRLPMMAIDLDDSGNVHVATQGLNLDHFGLGPADGETYVIFDEDLVAKEQFHQLGTGFIDGGRQILATGPDSGILFADDASTVVPNQGSASLLSHGDFGHSSAEVSHPNSHLQVADNGDIWLAIEAVGTLNFADFETTYEPTERHGLLVRYTSPQ
jgi:hypothetical protein